MRKWLSGIKERFGAWWPEIEPAVVMATGIFAAIMMSGCSPLTQLSAAQLTGLTTEQIDALDKAGQSVMVCLQGGGPPGGGSLSVVGAPKTARGSVSFAPDCHPTVNLQLGNGAPAPASVATVQPLDTKPAAASKP